MRAPGLGRGGLMILVATLATAVPTAGQTQEDGGGTQDATERGGVAVEPAEIVEGMFYTGDTLRVSAVVPEGAEVAMVCRGETNPLQLKRKGKVMGLIWMNVGDVSFERVPEVYLLRTSAPVSELASPSALRELDLGFDALAAHSEPGENQADLFRELIRLKERDRLWEVAEGAVRVQEAPEEGAALATTDFRLPARARAGVYLVQVYAFDRGRSELLGSAEVRVTQDRVAAFFTTLAKEHGLVYGILATVVAMAVGLFTGMIFGLGSKRGH